MISIQAGRPPLESIMYEAEHPITNHGLSMKGKKKNGSLARIPVINMLERRHLEDLAIKKLQYNENIETTGLNILKTAS